MARWLTPQAIEQHTEKMRSLTVRTHTLKDEEKPPKKEPRRNSRPKSAREPYQPEKIVLREVLAALRAHPKVRWAERMNNGAIETQGRFFRFGFAGCSDIIGQTKDGKFLAIECKSTTGSATPEQREFLRLVQESGGVSGLCRRASDVLEILNQPRKTI